MNKDKRNLPAEASRMTRRAAIEGARSIPGSVFDPQRSNSSASWTFYLVIQEPTRRSTEGRVYEIGTGSGNTVDFAIAMINFQRNAKSAAQHYLNEGAARAVSFNHLGIPDDTQPARFLVAVNIDGKVDSFILSEAYTPQKVVVRDPSDATGSEEI